MSWRFEESRRLYEALCGILFLIVAIAPLVAAFGSVFWNDGDLSLERWGRIVEEGRQRELLVRSLGIAFGAALLAVLFGAALGLLIEYVRIPGRKLLIYAAAAPFLLPPYIAATAWIDLLGNNGWIRTVMRDRCGFETPSIYSTGGVVLVLGLWGMPIVAFFIMAAVRRLDRASEESAAVMLTPWRRFVYVTAPLLAPGMACGATVVFLTALLTHSVPSLLQVDVYATEATNRLDAFQDLPGAVAVGLPMALLGVCAVGAWTAYVYPRRKWLAGSSRWDRKPVGGRLFRWSMSVGAWAPVGFAALLPFGVLVVRSASLESYQNVFSTAKEEMVRSVLVSAVSATFITTLAFSLAALTARSRTAWVIGGGALLTFLVSGPVLGVGLILLWNHLGWRGWIYDHLPILVLAHGGRHLFFAYLILVSAVRQVDQAVLESAAVFRIPWHGRWLRLLGPLTLPAILATWGLLFVLCFSEVEVTNLVYPPGWTTLPVRLFSLMHYGPGRYVAGLSVMMVGVLLASGLLLSVLYTKTKRRLDDRY